MASSVLRQDMPLRDHFQPDSTYAMSPSSNTSYPVFRPVSYNSPRSITEQKMRTSSVSSSTSPERRPSIPMERRSTVRFDDEPSQKSAVETTAPAPPQSSLEIYDTRELTAVDKKWGLLFDIDNQPTERFREAMHSLSRYIVRAFPTSSENIVLVPAKLASFYNFHGVDRDPFCYKVIFSSSDRDLNLNRRIADLYQDLGCSYHLVQAGPGMQPRIPGLTPDGFTRWMALHLQAFPDGVWQRLDRVISDFPLDVVSPLDGRTERLPKQLSRYLLPRVPDAQIRSLLQQAVKRHFGEAALLSFSFPRDKTDKTGGAVRPAPRSTQSCPSSPSHRSFPSPSTSTPAVIQASHRDGRTPEHIHRASDPGTMPYHTADDKDTDKMAPPAHRRHASYPGSQSKSRRSSEVVTSYHHRERERGERGERERDREERHRRSPSRPPSSRRSSMSRHNSPAPSTVVSTDRKEDVRRSSHHRQLALRDVEHHRSSSRDSSSRDTSSRDRDSLRRSSSRSSRSGIVSSSQASTTGSSSDSRRSKYPPSPLSTVQVHSSTTPPAAATKPKSSTPATNTSARRAPSPVRSKSSSHSSLRSSLPEIHHADRSDRVDRADRDRWRQSFMGTPTPRETGLARDAMEHSAEANRRTSYYGPPPSTAETRASSGEEHNYRLYGSPSSRETAAKASPMPTSTKADISPRVSLAATVTSLEDELALHKDDDGTESDQTWEDYLRSSPRLALT